MTMLYLGLMMTAFGYASWYSLLRRHSMGQTAPFLLLIPVVSILGAQVVLGETMSALALLGGAIVMAGVAFVLLEPAAKATEASGPPEPKSEA